MADYVYRLRVTYPEKPDLTDWLGGYSLGEDSGFFHWPKERAYLSYQGAVNRARLFSSYGATVTIERSERVQWAEPDHGTPDYETAARELQRLSAELAVRQQSQAEVPGQ